MKKARKESCSSKCCFVVVATIVCALYFVYYRASVADSVSYELSASFDRVDAPSSLYGVCPLPRTSPTPQLVAKEERKCEVEVPLTILNGEGKIVINQAANATEKQIRSCYARSLHDDTSWPWTWLKSIAVFFSRNQKLFWYTLEEASKIDDDFIEVDCLGYNNVHGRVRRREEIPMRINDTPDVIIIHVRSLKANIFTPQTTRFLEEAFGAVHFHNYQSLGDDYSDFGAMLAGGLAVPLSRDRVGSKEVPANLPRSRYDDPCFVARTTSFLPRLFEETLSYATLIADENRVHEEGFERRCGWEPTNLYTPIVHRFPPSSGCKFANYVLEHFRKFVEVYEGSAKFVTLRILHDDSVVDAELVETLDSLKEKISNTYIFFITDAPGEANLSPVPTPRQNIWISAPEQKRESLAMANLLGNQHALITPFDVHATLRVIAGLPNTSGSSLIEKLPSAVRDCMRLPIPLQHCPCPVARKNYTDIATQFEAAETALEPLSQLLKKYGCKQWDVERVYGVRRLEKFPLVDIFVAVRPLERNGFTHKFDRLDFPVFKLIAEESQTASSLVFTGLPELTAALKPMDHHLSTCMKGHWLRPFCYCESWKM